LSRDEHTVQQRTVLKLEVAVRGVCCPSDETV